MSRQCTEYNAATKTWGIRELADSENAVRDADAARSAEDARKPKPPTMEERIAAIEAALGIRTQRGAPNDP